MKVGTRSLLFGVHQVLIHPVGVALAWRRLYGRPGWRVLVCIFIHDWGYWGLANMDGEEGEDHPETGAGIAGWLFGAEYRDLCLLHSRHYARAAGVAPSRLCWADKMSILYEPWWFYLGRAWLSGELFEYRRNCEKAGVFPGRGSHRAWFEWLRGRLVKLGEERRGDAVEYHG
ncbi:MAG: hypothetical protein WC551_13640 [Patescibacteria group bacterium]|jgi:hypothetical protein